MSAFPAARRSAWKCCRWRCSQPRLAILDETDSGLDIDALRIVADGVNALRDPKRAFLVITHYQRLLDHITPDVVHVMARGRIVKTRRPGTGAGARAQRLSRLSRPTRREDVMTAHRAIAPNAAETTSRRAVSRAAGRSASFALGSRRSAASRRRGCRPGDRGLALHRSARGADQRRRRQPRRPTQAAIAARAPPARQAAAPRRRRGSCCSTAA